MTADRTFERIESLFDISMLRDINVLVAGCGSGGGNVALQLVMSGIRNFTLIDKDSLGPENVIRHVCGRRFIGQKKVDAVGEVLLDRNPTANIAKIDADIMTYPHLESEVRNADVVVLATDNEPSRYALNELCVRHGVSFAVGRVFTRGIGGEAFAYRPPNGGCLACLEAFLQRTPFRQGIREIDLVSEEEREKVYGMEIAEIKDSPGLGVDISFITSFHTRFVLDAIARRLPNRPKYLDLIDENYVVWGNRAVHPFKKHFQLQRVELSPQEQCAICAVRSVAHAV
ncbi:MAG TPA: ThiF family adenylyltransferase [Methyloceanibacter sp.]|nr:ThiF family adenylyltransferase [Methyloceanibacter sp.]